MDIGCGYSSIIMEKLIFGVKLDVDFNAYYIYHYLNGSGTSAEPD